uniref:Uncharacterized protein n=1 Tax=Rhizophora mucronata TaxID=61149 RepID=A0A2P2Q9H7_RHIMU
MAVACALYPLEISISLSCIFLPRTLICILSWLIFFGSSMMLFDA